MRCTLCPRRCAVDRSAGTGFCGAGDSMRVARAMLHFGEEPPISGTRGSGAVFFTGCSLRCVFCQNSTISAPGAAHGRTFTETGFIEVLDGLVRAGAHNINLVTPTHFAYPIARALEKYRPPVPVVWNSGGYESVETLRMLEGLVDVFLPDFKYAEAALAERLSSAPDYPETALAALREMRRQQPENILDADGILQKGVLIRHLILPGHTKNSVAALELLHREFPDTPVSLMAQYTPMGRVCTDDRFADLRRPITARERNKVLDVMLALDMPGYYQSRKSAGDALIPDFTQFDGKDS